METDLVSLEGKPWAITYTPYTSEGSCKSAEQVSSDIETIKAKGFSTVRLYATDCSGPQNVGSAVAANDMKVILGVYIDESGLGSNVDEQVAELASWGVGQWALVEMIVVGNEAVFNGYVSAGNLASFIVRTTIELAFAGYEGPITTTESLLTLQENGEMLCQVIDVVAANIHPFFNSDVGAADAGSFVASQLDEVAAVCNYEKKAYTLETGWPSQGKANGVAVPGLVQQKEAIGSIMRYAGSRSAIASFEDDLWKAPGDFEVEQSWGAGYLFNEEL